MPADSSRPGLVPVSRVLAIAISVGMGLDKLHADTVIFALVIFVGVGLVLRSYTVKPRQADPPAAGPH